MTSKKHADAEAALLNHRPNVNKVAHASTPFGQLAQEQRDVQLLPLNRVVPSPYQQRGIPNIERREWLRKSLEEDGLNSPIIVREVPKAKVSSYDTLLAKGQIVSSYDTYYELVAGHNRTDLFRDMGRDAIPGIVRVLSDVAAARMLVADNAQHQQLSDWEKFKHLRMLQQMKAAKTATDYANLLAVSSRAVYYQIEAFGKLPPVIHHLLDEKPDMIGGNAAYALRELADAHPDVVAQAIRKVADGKLKQAGMVRWVTDKVTPPVQVRREEHTLVNDRMRVKLVLTPDEVRLTGEGWDMDKVRALIEANLSALRAD